MSRKKEGRAKAVELFAGAGGMGLGLGQAGFEVALANEAEADFAESFRLNHPETRMVEGDVRGIDFRGEMKRLGLAEADLLSGGPPCQGFSTIGAKRRDDPRNGLFHEYLRAVEETGARYLLFENVAGFRGMYGGEAFRALTRELGRLGYATCSAVLEASGFGLPQVRKRTIVAGWKEGLPPVRLPEPAHGAGLLPPLTLMEAVSDLPALGADDSAEEYASAPRNGYQRKMRKGARALTEHNSTNHGEKMREILSLIPPGGTVDDLPARLRPRKCFANTYARLLPDQPAPTITRNFGTPSSSRCIHPFQDRALSTREGARLQGFPDSYRFHGSKGSKNLQIGNAVPPVLAKAVGEAIMAALRDSG